MTSTPALPGVAYPDATWPGRVDEAPLPIHPPVPRGYRTRLVAYRNNGPRLGALPDNLIMDALVGFNGNFGVLNLTYPLPAVNGSHLAGLLEDGAFMEIALEVHDGTSGWVEPDGARFLVGEADDEPGDEHDVVRLVGLSYGWIATKIRSINEAALLPPDDPSHPSKRPFLSNTPGQIVTTLLNEWAQRDTANVWARSFTTMTDSAGASWAGDGTWHFKHAQALDVILSSVVAAGLADWTTRGRELVMYNPDSELSRDLSQTVVLNLGADIEKAPTKRTITDLVSTIAFSGGRPDPDSDEVLYRVETSASAPKPWGAWEGEYTNQAITTMGGAVAALQRRLAEAGRVRGQYTRDLTQAAAAGRVPLVHFRPGDWITAPGADGKLEKVRVQQILIRDDGRHTTAGLILNDVLMDAQLRRALRERGLEDSAYSGGGSESPPPRPPGQDLRTPAAPTGLAGDTEAYSWGHLGIPRALVRLSWSAVTTARPEDGGGALEVARYETQRRRTTEGAEWENSRGTDSTTVTIDQLGTGEQWQFRVRARGRYATAPGVWSDPFTITTAEFVEPPPVPSTPVLSARLGVITAFWDGLTVDGTPMPVHFRRVEIAMTTSPTANPPGPPSSAVIGSLAVAGPLPVAGQPYNALRYFRARARGAGGWSDWTPEVSIAAEALVDTDLIADTILDAIEDSTAAIIDLNDNVIPGLQEGIGVAGGKFTASTNAPTPADGEGKAPGAIWNQYNANRLIGSWIWTESFVPGTYAWSPRQPQHVHIDTGTFGELDGIRLRAASVMTSALAVGDFENRLDNPYPILPPAGAPTGWGTHAHFSLVAADNPTTPGDAVWRCNGAGNASNKFLVNTRRTPVVEGEQWLLRCKIRAVSGVTSGNVGMTITRYNSNGAVITSTPVAAVSAPANGQTIQYEASYTIPAGSNPVAAAAGPWVAGAQNGIIDFFDFELVRKTGSVYIGDGAVVAEHVVASESLSAKVGQFLQVDTGMLNANEIWGDTAWLGLARVGVLTVGGVNPKNLSFGTDELCPNPMWIDSDYRALFPPTPAGMSYSTAATPRRKGQTHTVALAGSTVTSGTLMPISGEIPVSPGEKVALEVWGYRVSANFTANLRLVINLVGGGTASRSAALPDATSPNQAHSRGYFVANIPDGAVTAYLAIVASGTPTTGTWYISEVSARKAMTSQDETGAGMEFMPGAIRAWNQAGTPWLTLANGEPALIAADTLRTGLPGGAPHVVLRNDLVNTGLPAVWFTKSGLTDGDQARIALDGTTGSTSRLVLNSERNQATGVYANVRVREGLEVFNGPFRVGSGNYDAPTWTLTATPAGDLTIANTLRVGAGFDALGLITVPTEGVALRDPDAGEWMRLHRPGGLVQIRSNAIYNRTNAGAGNVHINSNGDLWRSTSLRAAKVDITPATLDLDTVRALQPVTFRDRGEVERGEDARTQVGLIAEDVDSLGLHLGMYDADGEISGIAYERGWLLHHPWLLHHDQQIAALTDTIAALTARIDAMEAA